MNGHVPKKKEESKDFAEIHTNPDYMPSLGGYVMEIPEELKDKILVTNMNYDCYEEQTYEQSYEQKTSYECGQSSTQVAKGGCNARDVICKDLCLT